MIYHRRLPKFDYLAPKGVAEVLSLLDEHKGEARLFAGGTIAIHQMKERAVVRPYLIGLKGVVGLGAISVDAEGGLAIGATALLQDVADSAAVRQACPLLSSVCGRLGTPQIRNMGTIGGNAAIRFSTSECLPALITLRARAVLASSAGERVVPVEELHRQMKAADLLTVLNVPSGGAGMRTGCEKFAVRQRFDYATVSACAAVVMDGARCLDATIGLGGVSLPTMRARAAEDLLKDRVLEPDVITKAAEAAAESGRTASDIMFSAEYKKKVLKVMVERAVRAAAAAQK